MCISGLLIINCLSNKIETNNMWKSDTKDTMIDTLHTVISIFEQWIFVITTLIEQWKQDFDTPWKGDEKSMISIFETLRNHTDKVGEEYDMIRKLRAIRLSYHLKDLHKISLFLIRKK